MRKTRVGVLRGGPSGEYEVSLKTGQTALAHIPEEYYEAHDIFIDTSGVWHFQGTPATPEQLSRRIDVAVNALHGAYGEDGQIQKELEAVGIPYTGAGVATSAVAFHKHHAKERFRAHNIRTPGALLVREYDDSVARKVFERVSPPYVLKPVRGGSSQGIVFASGMHDLPAALYHALSMAFFEPILVEQRIVGREATVGVIDNFRGEDVYALPPVEIIPPEEAEFFDYDAKYSGKSQEIVPSNFSCKEKEELTRLAKEAHKALGLRHYSRTDFIVTKNKIYALETNTLPGLTEESLFPKSLSAIGTTLSDFFHHLIGLALGR